MKIMVCIKQVPHQDARLDINGAGTWIAEDNIKFEINQYDQHALEAALALKDKDASTEVVVVSIGPERVTQSLRTALGMGADRAVHVKDAAADGSDALGVAKILAAVAQGREPRHDLRGLHGRRRQLRRGRSDARDAARRTAHHDRRELRQGERQGARRARAGRRRARGGRAHGAVPRDDPDRA